MSEFTAGQARAIEKLVAFARLAKAFPTRCAIAPQSIDEAEKAAHLIREFAGANEEHVFGTTFIRMGTSREEAERILPQLVSDTVAAMLRELPAEAPAEEEAPAT